MGWFERQPDGSVNRWYVKPVKEFFTALLEVRKFRLSYGTFRTDIGDQDCAPSRPRPNIIIKDGMVQQVSNESIAYKEVSSESLKLVNASERGSSGLRKGW